jgi:Mg-chelatase subunit ChlD
VLNPSFEDSTGGPPSRGCNKALQSGYHLTQGWYQVGGSADFYNSDLSKGIRNTRLHKARSGQGRIGLVMGERSRTSARSYYREYVQTQLKEPLKAGALYSVNFYIVRDKRSIFYAPQAGACFTGIPASTDASFNLRGSKAQVITKDYKSLTESEKWSLVHGYYRAVGGERYLTIGNFNEDSPLQMEDKKIPSKLFTNDYGWYAYYYIDDVCVAEVQDSTRDNFSYLMPKSEVDKPFNNLVFVLDVSASMKKDDKIKKLKTGVDNFLSSLDTNEIISVITFDASPKVLAQHLKSAKKNEIISAIDSLRTGGGTNVNVAIQRAYDLLDNAYIPGGNNRVIVVTDAGYQVSEHTRKIIEEHAQNRQAGFSTLVFDNIKYRSLKQLCSNNRGTYNNINSNTVDKALTAQAKERPINYYGPGRNKTYTYFTVRLALVAIIAALIATKVSK